VEIGSHQQLLSQGGIYHRLHSLQETGELLWGKIKTTKVVQHQAPHYFCCFNFAFR
jgi:hypothetical protein